MYKQIWYAELLRKPVLSIVADLAALHPYIEFAIAHDSESVVKQLMKEHDMMIDVLNERKQNYRGLIRLHIDDVLGDCRKYSPTVYWLHS